MSNFFDYIPHPHMEKRKEAGPPKVAAAVAQVHGPGLIGRVNAKIGLKLKDRQCLDGEMFRAVRN